MYGVNRLGCWKVTFCARFHRDAYVPVKSDRRRALSVVPSQSAVKRVTLQRRPSPTPTQHLLGVVKRQHLGVAALSATSACQQRAATQAALSRPGRCLLVAVSVHQNQCQMSDSRDDRRNVYYVILTVAVMMTWSWSQWSAFYAAGHIVINTSQRPCCIWISVGLYVAVV